MSHGEADTGDGHYSMLEYYPVRLSPSSRLDSEGLKAQVAGTGRIW
jgi:hypothetical protein